MLSPPPRSGPGEPSRRPWLGWPSDELDVLVIGAGVTGGGSALDAVTRGLRVGLVEARDFASGTSSRSSKLFHGGLRYLEQLNFALVFEALKERSLALNTLAPHLAKPVPFIYPLTRPGVDRAYAGLGIGVYDVMGAGRGVPNHLRHLGRKKTLELFPSANRRDRCAGSIQFYEGQVDDARHTMMLSRTAAHYGAAVATSTRVVGFLREADRVAGVRVRDLETGRRVRHPRPQTINAAGVWIDELQKMLGGRGQFRVRASKGIHLVVPREPDQLPDRADHPDREEPAVHHPLDQPLDHRHHRHRLAPRPGAPGGQPGRHRLPARPGEPAARRPADPRRRGRGVRRAAAAAGRRVRLHLQAVPRARGRLAGARPDHGRRREVHDLPGDGQGRRRRRGARPRTESRCPPSCTEDVPLLGAEGYRALWNARPLRGRADRAARRPRSSTC